MRAEPESAGLPTSARPTPGAGGTVKIANIAGAPTPWATASNKVAGSPFLECVPGTRVPGRDVLQRWFGQNGSVVKTAGRRVDDDRHRIKLDGDDGRGA